MFRLEVFQVRPVFFVFGRFFILGQDLVIFLLQCLAFVFERLPLLGQQDLPSFAYELGDFREAEFLPF